MSTPGGERKPMVLAICIKVRRKQRTVTCLVSSNSTQQSTQQMCPRASYPVSLGFKSLQIAKPGAAIMEQDATL